MKIGYISDYRENYIDSTYLDFSNTAGLDCLMVTRLDKVKYIPLFNLNAEFLNDLKREVWFSEELSYPHAISYYELKLPENLCEQPRSL